MLALDRLRDLIALVNAGDSCPCDTLGDQGFGGVDGGREATTQLLAEMGGAVDLFLAGRIADAEQHAGHVLLIALHLGFILGAESAYDVVLSSDVVVPDTIATVDFLGDQ